MLCFLRSFESTYTSLYRAISNHSVFYLCVGLSVVEWTNTCLPLRSWLVVRGNQCSHEKLCRVRCVCARVCACVCEMLCRVCFEGREKQYDTERERERERDTERDTVYTRYCVCVC